MTDSADIVIAGSGPAALAAASTFQRDGLSVLVLERGSSPAAGITKYPYYMKFFSTAPNLEVEGFPLIITDEKPTREEYLNYLRRFVRERRIPVALHREVTAIEPRGTPGEPGAFAVRAKSPWGEVFTYSARLVVVAIGAFDVPNALGCPGEDLPKVSHFFTEVHPYAFSRVAVVGGKNSAAETALLLFRAGAEVTIIHRGTAMAPLKFWLQPDLENRIRSGEIRAHFSSRVAGIRPHEIVVEGPGGVRTTLANDFVLAMTGYRPDTALLEKFGIGVDSATARPAFDPDTLESNVPGIYLAGVMLSGSIGGEIFIENSRHHGEVILRSAQARLAAARRVAAGR